MKPAIKVVSWLNWVVTDNIIGKCIVVSSPGGFGVGKRGNWQSVGSKAWFNHAGKYAVSAIGVAFGPLELAIGEVAIISFLVPVGNWQSDSLWVIEGSSLPDSGDAIFVSNGFKRHGTNY